MNIEYELLLRLFLALVFGAIIGFEREYRSKAAGFRTITLISIGSALFTITSYKLGYPGNPDRIASNIITGIGFIGAGVVFKDGGFVSGLTTAATIWIAAAMGMALGNGEYLVASITLGLAIIVLSLFETIQDWIDRFHQVKPYKVNFFRDYEKPKIAVEEELKRLEVSFKIVRCVRNNDDITFYYTISGSQDKLNRFTDFLLGFREVKSFDE
jgi:putative Mg2+ transporter-C (MgtC) family protein